MFLSLCLLVLTDYIYSQNENITNFSFDIADARARAGKKIELIYDRIKGSPYYNEKPVSCSILFSDLKTRIVDLKYDLFQDEMEFFYNNKTLWLDKKSVRVIKFGEENIVVALPKEKNAKLEYFFLQDTGQYKLLVKKNVEYFPSVPPKPYGEPVPESFERIEDKYYIKINDQQPQYFRSKKELLGILGNKPEITDFFNKEKIRIEEISSLMKFIDFLNHIQN